MSAAPTTLSMTYFLHRFERSGLHCGSSAWQLGDRGLQLHRFERSGLHCGVTTLVERITDADGLHRFERSGLHCGRSMRSPAPRPLSSSSPLRKKRSPLRRFPLLQRSDGSDDFTASKEAVSIAARQRPRSPVVADIFTASKEAVSIAAWAQTAHASRMSQLHRFERSGLHCGVPETDMPTVHVAASPLRKKRSPLRHASRRRSSARMTSSPFRKKRFPLRRHPRWPLRLPSSLHRFERSGLHCGVCFGPCGRWRRCLLHRFERSGLHCGTDCRQTTQTPKAPTSPLRKKRSPLRRRHRASAAGN